MEIRLAEQIRSFRKQRKMTQEQLAETLGVTIGAVSKWERAQSTPELRLIVELAELFETSVDVLLGYQLQSGALSQLLSQIRSLREERRYEEAIRIGEKALQKFPNNFDVVYQTALCYLFSGAENNREQCRRAERLLLQSLDLIEQNHDPEISDWLIRNQLGETYCHLREAEKAVEIYKANNFNGINNAKIAHVLSDVLKRTEEASIYAKRSFRSMVELTIDTMVSLAVVLDKENKIASFPCLLWLLNMLESIRPDEGACITDQMLVNLYQATGECYLMSGEREEAKEYLRKAFRLAKLYDNTPAENIVECRFFSERLPGRTYHEYGGTAYQLMHNRLHWNSREEEPEYFALWEEVQAEVNNEE